MTFDYASSSCASSGNLETYKHINDIAKRTTFALDKNRRKIRCSVVTILCCNTTCLMLGSLYHIKSLLQTQKKNFVGKFQSC